MTSYIQKKQSRGQIAVSKLVTIDKPMKDNRQGWKSEGMMSVDVAEAVYFELERIVDAVAGNGEQAR